MEEFIDIKVNSAELENVDVAQDTSINIGVYEHAYFDRPWHYHPEFELMLITKGFGTRMVGDHFEKFDEGDLVLLKGNLPHAWISDPYFTKTDNNEACKSVYIQFHKKVFGTHFIEIPEMQGVRTMLEKAERGIKILGVNRDEISQQMLLIHELSPIEKILALIRMIDLIEHTEYELLASQKYYDNKVKFKEERMTNMHNYIMQNFQNELNITTCAKQLNMTTTSFCRFFKKQTNVPFSAYLNYIRINFSQKLLSNTDLPIKSIAYDSGYSSVVYFNQVFKKLTGLSPRQFRKR
jgi:YesN/AraC family two-component response regulator